MDKNTKDLHNNDEHSHHNNHNEHHIHNDLNHNEHHNHDDLNHNEHHNHDDLNHNEHHSHDEHNHHDHHNHNMDHSDHSHHHADMVKDFKKRFFVSLIITILILILSPMIQMFLDVDWSFPYDSYILFGLSTILLIYGGKPFFLGAWDELKKKTPAMMMLITLAILVSYIYSSFTVFGFEGNDFFWESSTLIVIMLLGHWIEMKSAMGASKALEALVDLMPKVAHLIQENGETIDIPVEELKIGNLLLLKPGESIPIDGIVYDGLSTVNESMITGESVPVEKTIGDEVIGGAINGEGILKFKVNKVGDNTFLSQVIKLVRDAQSSKSKTQRLADIAAKWLFYIAIIAGIITFIAWTLADRELAFVLERTVTVIVISCPHALGVAIPLVTSVSTSIAAKNGLLIRNRVAFENARKINAVVFDKTGTLTLGKFGITDIYPINFSEEELLEIAYSLESNSEHPIAEGIVNSAKAKNINLKEVAEYQTIPGVGLTGMIEGITYMIVSPNYMKKNNIAFDESIYNSLASVGKTVVFVISQNKLIGVIALSDIIRETSVEVIQDFKNLGITTFMLTGDNKIVADYVGGILGIDNVIAEVLPSEKAEVIEKLQRDGYIVAMTGDGVNDAPSLAKADLGIAIGAGTDVAIETADVILVKDNPRDVISLIKLSIKTYKKMIQNLIWATAYNIIALPLAAGILYNIGIVISPALGAILMSLSAIIVSINAQLLKID